VTSSPFSNEIKITQRREQWREKRGRQREIAIRGYPRDNETSVCLGKKINKSGKTTLSDFSRFLHTDSMPFFFGYRSKYPLYGLPPAFLARTHVMHIYFPARSAHA